MKQIRSISLGRMVFILLLIIATTACSSPNQAPQVLPAQNSDTSLNNSSPTATNPTATNPTATNTKQANTPAASKSPAPITAGPMTGVYGSKAKGSIPEILGNQLLVGLFENKGETWMKKSGVPWNSRYLYLTKGWANNWGWGKNDGTYALDYMVECNKMNALPVIQFYIMNNEPGGGEEAFYQKTQNPSTMLDYFSEFKLLMKNAKTYNKPVLVLLEGDGFGFMQHQTKNNPNAYSAIKASGIPELSALPDTAAGWGLAFLQLRKALGASNVVLGIHVTAWSSGMDISYHSINIPLQPEVDKVFNFLSPLGLRANQTGATYDVLYGDPLDRDSDFYKITKKEDRWWNASDSAAIQSKSFNRYAEWLRLWNQKANKRWILWQIPLGNSNHLNVYNNGKPREGYKDNRTEYFFGPGSREHLAKWADAGVIGLLFGAGAAGQSTYINDLGTDGQPYLKTHAGTFLKNGGMTLFKGK